MNDADRIAVDAWLHGRGKDTRRTYTTAITQWDEWCTQHQVPFLTPEVEHCRAYHQHLLDRTPKNATVANRCRAVSSLFGHATRGGHRPEGNPWDHVTIVAPPAHVTMDHLGDEDHARLLAFAATDAAAEVNALVRLLGVLGMRVTQALQFRLDDLKATPEGWRYRSRGKGGRESVRPVDDVTADAVQTAAAGRTTGLLFPSEQDPTTPITDRTARRWIRTLCTAARVPPCPPHGLRRSVADRILEASGDLRQVQAALDHASITTSARYDQRADLASQALTHVLTTTHQPTGEPHR